MPSCSCPSLRQNRSNWSHVSGWGGQTWSSQATAEPTQVRPLVPAGKNENPFSEMFLSTNSNPRKKGNTSDSEFLSSYGSADSGRHREWSEHNIQLNFQQEITLLHWTQESQVFALIQIPGKLFFLELLILLEGSICCLTVYERRKHAGSMISHTLEILSFKLLDNYCLTIG